MIASESKELMARIEFCMHEWKESQNPFAIWAAIDASGKLGRDLPPWVRDYLCQVSAQLLDGEPPGKALAMTVKGGHGKLKQWTDSYKRHRARWRCFRLQMANLAMDMNEIFRLVAKEMNVEEKTVEKWYYDHQDREYFL
jgi:hypothetical protein